MTGASSVAYSEVEICWKQLAGEQSLKATRSLHYDPATMLLHRPIRYEPAPFATPPPTTLPSDDWIAANLNSLVLGESGATANRGTCPDLPPPGKDKRYISDVVVKRYLQNCEAECVYSGIIDAIVDDRDLSIAEKITRILSHDLVGNRENLKYVTAETIATHVNNAVSSRLPLRFVLPAFPFKDQNPFRSLAAPNYHIDLGELALIIRLHTLALAITQIHLFGVQFVIISDGIPYARFFNIDWQGATSYQSKLRDYRTWLNLQNTVHIIDMDEMVARLPQFDELNSGIEQCLQQLAVSGVIKDKLLTLARGMKWNMNTKQYLDEHSNEQLWKVLNGDVLHRPSTALKELEKRVTKDSWNVALRYAAFNLTMKYVGLIDLFLPNSIRMTVHAKPGQVSAPRLGELYPWNGVARVVDDNLGSRSIESVPGYKVCLGMTGAYLPGETAPFCFVPETFLDIWEVQK